MNENNNPSIQMTNTERILEVKHFKIFPDYEGLQEETYRRCSGS